MVFEATVYGIGAQENTNTKNDLDDDVPSIPRGAG